MRTKCEPPHRITCTRAAGPTNPPRGCLARRLFVQNTGAIDTWDVDYDDDQATWRLVEAPVTELPDWDAAAAAHLTMTIVGAVSGSICCILYVLLKCRTKQRRSSHQTRVRTIVRQASGGRFCACSSTTSSSTTGTSLNPAPNPLPNPPTIVAGTPTVVAGTTSDAVAPGMVVVDAVTVPGTAVP